MRAFSMNRPPVAGTSPLDPHVLCRHIEQQRFPDLGFFDILSGLYEAWEAPDYLIHLRLRHRMTRTQQRQTLIARPCGEAGALTFRVARELWAKVFCRSEQLGMGRPLGFIEDQGLLLQFLPD